MEEPKMPEPVSSTPAEPREPTPDYDRIDALAAEFEQRILNEAANWGEDFDAGPGVVCSVKDAARVIARHVAAPVADQQPEPAPKEGEALGVTNEQRADLNKAVSDTWDMLAWPAVKHAMCPLPCYGKPGDRWRCGDCGRVWRAIDGPTAIAWERVSS